MSVFDCHVRTDTSPKVLSESIFTFWNRSGKPSSEACRELIEGWVSHLPEAEQDNLRSRFRSGSDHDCGAAFQELCLHEFLLRQQCTVFLHPLLPGTTNHPDYRVLQPDRTEFILEAVASTTLSRGPEINPLRNPIRDRLQKLRLDGFYIGIDELTAGTRAIAWRSVERHINEQIKKVAADRFGSIPLPPLTTVDGWRLKLTLWPRPSDADSGVSYEGWSGTAEGPASALVASLRKKGSRYGELGLPFVVAVNSFDVMCTDHDFDRVLFGDPPNSAMIRPQSGFWGAPAAPLFRRVSAVLFTKNLWPETVLMGQVQACLYFNPWAHLPYRGVFSALDSVEYVNGVLQRKRGVPLHHLLGVTARTSHELGF